MEVASFSGATFGCVLFGTALQGPHCDANKLRKGGLANPGWNRGARKSSGKRRHGRIGSIQASAQKEQSNNAATADKSSDTSSDNGNDASATADRLVAGLSFTELCSEFVCTSSPALERSARQLVKDILDLREGLRTTSVFAKDVTYKDPLRSFKGRSKYRRLTYWNEALENPSVAVQEMRLINQSTLLIRYVVKGRPKVPPASFLPGEVVVDVKATFEVNQISGQVTSHTEEWDLSGTAAPQLPYFFSSRLAFSVLEKGRDAKAMIEKQLKNLSTSNDDTNIYVDPTDPRRFFQEDRGTRDELYQLAFLAALIYLLVQVLRYFI